MSFFDKIIKLNKSPIGFYVTPLTPYFICDHFISTEINSNDKKYILFKMTPNGNDLLKNKNYDKIKNYEIIQIQVDHFDFFCDEIMPIIQKNNIKVVIITSQFHLPPITKNEKTDKLLNSENILLWISQNPIYTNNQKYMAFPYGILHLNINHYIRFIKKQRIPSNKKIKILNQHSTVHKHLPENHIRKKYKIFGVNSGKMLIYKDYLKNILNSQFVISTAGDRDDCYRHYECIGLNAIPISNIGDGYKDIFGENMIYSNAEEMRSMVHNKSVTYKYKKPNRDILTIHYWLCKINERISLLKNKNTELVFEKVE